MKVSSILIPLRKSTDAAGMFCLAVAILGTTACQPEASDASPMPGGEIQSTKLSNIPVETLSIQSSNFIETFDVIGLTEPLESVRISSEIPGLIELASVEKGKAVSKGELLYRIDTDVDKARLNVLRSQVSTAQRELDRMKKLSADGLGTPQQLDQAEAALENAQLNLRQAQVGLAKSTVNSPISGHVTVKYADAGEYAAPGNPLVEIVDYSTIVIKAHVPESNIGYIVHDTQVDVEIPALGKKLKGVVKHRSIQPAAPTRTYPVEIHIPNEELAILPGMRARIVVPKRQWDDVIIVPREAILEGVHQQEAMVVEQTPDNLTVARIRPVELGPGQGSQVIVTTGLNAGEQIIIRGHRGLVTGANVEVVRSN